MAFSETGCQLLYLACSSPPTSKPPNHHTDDRNRREHQVDALQPGGTQGLVALKRGPVLLRPGLLPPLFIIPHNARRNVLITLGGALRVSSFVY